MSIQVWGISLANLRRGLLRAGVVNVFRVFKASGSWELNVLERSGVYNSHRPTDDHEAMVIRKSLNPTGSLNKLAISL